MTKRVLWFTMAPALLLADVATARVSAVPLAAVVVLTQQRRADLGRLRKFDPASGLAD
jgi:hypothetical protein